MCKKEMKIMVIEKFKNEDVDKRKETLEKLFYNLIKNREESCDIVSAVET
ncbi:hypothetical protein [Clostridium sp. DJ247]|nr:hypothetical protein [Clostridium sp. DJ247]MBC2579728.1 hypothetical protein [Clostridium sp. DJ247]